MLCSCVRKAVFDPVNRALLLVLPIAPNDPFNP